MKKTQYTQHTKQNGASQTSKNFPDHIMGQVCNGAPREVEHCLLQSSRIPTAHRGGNALKCGRLGYTRHFRNFSIVSCGQQEEIPHGTSTSAHGCGAMQHSLVTPNKRPPKAASVSCYQRFQNSRRGTWLTVHLWSACGQQTLALFESVRGPTRFDCVGFAEERTVFDAIA